MQTREQGAKKKWGHGNNAFPTLALIRGLLREDPARGLRSQHDTPFCLHYFARHIQSHTAEKNQRPANGHVSIAGACQKNIQTVVWCCLMRASCCPQDDLKTRKEYWRFIHNSNTMAKTWNTEYLMIRIYVLLNENSQYADHLLRV